MRRILIVFASSHGQTRQIARTLAARFEAAGHLVELADAAVAVPEPRGFDAVVIGSRVQFGKHAPAIVRYVQAHRAALATLPTAFFSVSMSAAQAGASEDPNGYLAQFFAATGWQPGCAEAIGGALRYRQYNWILRRVMTWLAKRGGHATDTSRDHVYTDWAAVTRFADHITAGLDHHDQRVRSTASAGTAA
jgi:menaquinone-dependent protoporphyrinogen oxidase